MAGQLGPAEGALGGASVSSSALTDVDGWPGGGEAADGDLDVEAAGGLDGARQASERQQHGSSINV